MMSRCPLGSTPVTTAVIVPEKSLLASVDPLPSWELELLASLEARARAPGLMKGSAATLPFTTPVR